MLLGGRENLLEIQGQVTWHLMAVVGLLTKFSVHWRKKESHYMAEFPIWLGGLFQHAEIYHKLNRDHGGQLLEKGSGTSG